MLRIGHALYIRRTSYDARSVKLPRKAAGFIRAVAVFPFSDRPVRFLNDFDKDLENNAYRSATLNMVYSLSSPMATI